ncbi:hypothetical protein OROGR_004213 [Orobanche gracilis]
MNQVRKLLKDDPKNSEYSDMEKELVEFKVPVTEERYFYSCGVLCADAQPALSHEFQMSRWIGVIALTEELLATARQSDTGAASPNPHHSESALHVSHGAIGTNLHCNSYPVESLLILGSNIDASSST